jgi:outer membrane receptor protein involved in Fe transport
MKKIDLLLGTACGTVMLCSAVAFAGHAFAQDNGATPIQGISKSAGGTGTVAQGLKQKIPLKSQYAASHISKAEIATKSPVATLDSILNTEPSIHATSAGPLGVEQQITFRDFNSAEFTQTFDHISLNDVFNAGATNSASVYNNVLITPLEIQGVELYRGINNPANNSYNSLAGTINYDPVLPSDTMGGSLSGNFGSFDTMGYNAIYNTGKVNGFSNVIGFSRETTKGWLQGDKDSNSNFYDAFNQDIDPIGKIYGLVVYNTNNGEEAYDIPAPLIQALGRNFQYPKSIYNEPLQNTNDLIIFGATQGLGDVATVDLKGFFGADNFTRNAFSNSAYQSTGYYVFNKDVNHTDTTFYGYYGTEAGFQPTVTLDLPYNTITAGANYTLGHLHSREYYSNIDPVPQMPGVNDIWDEHDVRIEYSVYLQDEVDLLNDTLKLTPGVKYLYANSKDTDDAGYDYPVAGSVSSTAHFISPTVGASYEFIPNTVLYAAYGQNIEFPTIDAYYNNIDGQNAQGNYENNIEPVHLQPEHVNDYEAGLRYSNQPLGFAGALGFYLENFTNTFIESVDPTSQLQTTSNGGSSQYKGIELQLTQDFGHPHYDGNDLGDFAGYLNYSYNDAYFTSNFTISSVGNNNASLSTVHKNDPVALVPRDTVDFGGTWSLDGFGANIDAQYVTSQFINQETAGTPSSLQEPAYFVLNLQVSKTIPVQHLGIVKSIEIALNIDNALDREYDAYAYSETYSTPKNPPGPYVAPKGSKGAYASIQQAAPRAFYGSVTLKF